MVTKLQISQIHESCTPHAVLQVFNYAKTGLPRKHGDHWYMYHNSGLQNQYVLYKLAGEGACGMRARSKPRAYKHN